MSILSVAGRIRSDNRAARHTLSARENKPETTARSRTVHCLYGFVLVAVTALGSSFAGLVQIHSDTGYPRYFTVFRPLFYVEHGLFLATVLALILYLVAKFRVERGFQLVACAAFYTWLLWIMVWGLVHHAYKIELTFASVIDLVSHWQTIAEVGFTSREFTFVLIIAALIVSSLTVATLPLVRRAGAEARRVWFVRWLIAFITVHLLVRAYFVYHVNHNQPAVIAYDDCVALPLRSELLLPRFRTSRFAIPDLASHQRTVRYLKTMKELRVLPMPLRPNILWLNIESFRYDAITPEVMPSLWARRESFQIRLDQDHWSGGNATQFGVFSMLTGLSGGQFDTFESAGVKVPFLTLLAQNGYRLRGGKSSYFSYGGLYKLLPATMELARLPRRALYKEDVATIDQYLRDRSSMPGTQPRFDFLPFDATHFPYGFTTGHDVFRPSMLVRSAQHAFHSAEGLEPVRNRYRNACHFIDSQINRLLDDLESRGGFADTIVIIVGDHGEEFQERGQLTHAGVLNDFQGRTVLWMHFPDLAAHQIQVQGPTMHLDIIPTILSAVGFKADVLYTQGVSLLENRGKRGVLSLCEQGFRIPLYRDLVTHTFISRWSHRGQRWLFSGVQRRDGRPVADQTWLAEARAHLEQSARMYELLPDTSQPPRRFNLP
ncbi:MAG TPA: sulfatase-like hydrolase/transferase [Chthoniobacterales bacterium]|nr:sulfatase-like hydrolase/transferase [Chthoniobacterales bacterium]